VQKRFTALCWFAVSFGSTFLAKIVKLNGSSLAVGWFLNDHAKRIPREACSALRQKGAKMRATRFPLKVGPFHNMLGA